MQFAVRQTLILSRQAKDHPALRTGYTNDLMLWDIYDAGVQAIGNRFSRTGGLTTWARIGSTCGTRVCGWVCHTHTEPSCMNSHNVIKQLSTDQ
jgi:hypothetical protein